MLNRIARALCVLTLGTLVGGQVAVAQSSYPERPIRLIAPFPPGGGTDYIARLIATKLTETTKWSIAVDNKAGAGGTIGVGELSRAQPTGYDLAIGQRDNLVFAPNLQKVAFDPLKDFQPVAFIAGTPMVIVASIDGKYQSFTQVADAARANPGAISLGSPGHGSTPHVLNELLRTRAGVQFQHVPYKGSTPALTDVVGGQIDIAATSIASANALIKGGKLRPLAVAGKTRSPSLPDVPTLIELGFTNVEAGSWYGLIAPAGLPADIAQTLHAQVALVLQRPEVIEMLHAQGLAPEPQSVAAFTQLVRDDYAAVQGIVKETGIEPL